LDFLVGLQEDMFPLFCPVVYIVSTTLQFKQNFYRGKKLVSSNQLVKLLPEGLEYIGRVIPAPAVNQSAGVDAIH
jgi:hypothetical protein